MKLYADHTWQRRFKKKTSVDSGEMEDLMETCCSAYEMHSPMGLISVGAVGRCSIEAIVIVGCDRNFHDNEGTKLWFFAQTRRFLDCKTGTKHN